MSKSLLKTHLQSLTKEQIIEQVLDMYETYKPAKEYFDYLLNPNEKEHFNKYKSVIINEFYPKGKNSEPTTRFSIAKRAISDFSNLKPSPQLIGDLMVTFIEMACKFTHDYGDMSEKYYDSTISNFEKALKYLHNNGLLDEFKLRCQTCLDYASNCGYGFPYDMSDLYMAYYEDLL